MRKLPIKFWFLLKAILWVMAGIILAITLYVNWALPHGTYYDTGDVVCENDERGPCHEALKEDVSKLHIPNWAKVVRQNWESWLIILGAAGLLIVYLEPKEKK